MKWKNKGHEFDKDWDNISGLEGIYLFGAGHDGKMVLHTLNNKYKGIKIKGFLDNNEELWGKTVDDVKVFRPDEIKKTKGIGVVISFASEIVTPIENQLKELGFTEHINMWHFEQFVAIYAAYKYKEVYFSSVCILPTDACNLRCKACLNFTTYIKKFKHQPIEKLKKEIDLYFRNVDYTGLFFISGGEPLLYPKLAELIEYIESNYDDKIYEIGIVTNGTIIPSKEVIDCLENSRIKLTVDDYRATLSDKEEAITYNIKFFKSLMKDNIRVRKYDEWISLYPHEINELKEDELIKKYDQCHCPWQEYKDGALSSCNYAGFAYNAELSCANKGNDYYYFSELKKSDVKELMEFRLGYTVKGYVEFCKICAGYMDINPYKENAAEQL